MCSLLVGWLWLHSRLVGLVKCYNISDTITYTVQLLLVERRWAGRWSVLASGYNRRQSHFRVCRGIWGSRARSRTVMVGLVETIWASV